jgi:hypothetical protein
MNWASRWFDLGGAALSSVSIAEVEMAQGISFWPFTIENSTTILSNSYPMRRPRVSVISPVPSNCATSP